MEKITKEVLESMKSALGGSWDEIFKANERVVKEIKNKRK